MTSVWEAKARMILARFEFRTRLPGPLTNPGYLGLAVVTGEHNWVTFRKQVGELVVARCLKVGAGTLGIPYMVMGGTLVSPCGRTRRRV